MPIDDRDWDGYENRDFNIVNKEITTNDDDQTFCAKLELVDDGDGTLRASITVPLDTDARGETCFKDGEVMTTLGEGESAVIAPPEIAERLRDHTGSDAQLLDLCAEADNPK